MENYRSISILSCIPKVFEKLVHAVLAHVVQPSISDCQHGFAAKRSTTTNLITFVTDVLRSMENRRQVDAIYVDFAKAFDRVPHLLAVEKMRRLGLPVWITNWIQSFLTSRSAIVKVYGSKSEMFTIPSGVPQGSHLGPLIFVLFINDLCHWIKNDKVLYADDLKFYRAVSSPIDCLALQSDMDSLMKWCDENGMEVNAKKCQVITFDPKLSPVRNTLLQKIRFRLLIELIERKQKISFLQCINLTFVCACARARAFYKNPLLSCSTSLLPPNFLRPRQAFFTFPFALPSPRQHTATSVSGHPAQYSRRAWP